MKFCTLCLKDSKCSACSKCSCEKSKCKLHKCCNSCTFCVFERAAAKEWRKSQCRFRIWPNKACERCFFCKTVSFCASCDKCPQCCRRSACGGPTAKLLASLGPEEFKSESSIYPEGGYNLPFSHKLHLTRIPLIRSGYANPRRDSYLQEALHSPLQKRAVEKVRVQSSLGFYNRLFIVPKPNQKWRPILDLSALNRFLKVKIFKMETPESIRLSLQPGEWVTSLDFSDAYFHIPISPNSRKFLRFSFHNQTFQFRVLPFGLSTALMEFTIVVKEVKLVARARNIWMHQYLDDWLIRVKDRDTCFQDTQTLLALCQELGWVVNLRKSELEPKLIFNFVPSGQNKRSSVATCLSGPAIYRVIGLLTATEKHVHFGRLHMRPIQWHLKNNWRIREPLGKVIPIPRTLHPHLQWWLQEENVLTGQPLHPIKHALQIFTDASKEGWGAHLNEHTSRGSWSVPESKLHINFLELKAVFLALKEFKDLCAGQIVLVAMDNITVVSYINKEGGMKSGPLCALLWRILTWCTQRQVTLKARHIPGRLNVIADKLSRLGQTIQTEWSLLPEVFQTLCYEWHRPLMDLLVTRFNHKLPLFVSPVPDPMAVAVDTLTLPWEDLDAYAFPPIAILGKVVEKLQDSPCKRIILIAPGWPNMPWLGLSDHVQSGPSQSAQSVDTTLQPGV